MKRVASLLLVACSVAAAAPAFQWPAASYKGKPRDARWLEAAYTYFMDKVAIIEGQAVDTRRVFDHVDGLKLGTCFKGSLVINQVLDGELLLRFKGSVQNPLHGVRGGGPLNLPTKLRIIHVKGVDTAGLVDDAWWKGTLAGVGSYRYVTPYKATKTVLSCVVLPDKRPPLTRPQFLDVIKSGFELARWSRRQRPTSQPGFGRYIYERRPVD